MTAATITDVMLTSFSSILHQFAVQIDTKFHSFQDSGAWRFCLCESLSSLKLLFYVTLQSVVEIIRFVGEGFLPFGELR